MSSPQLSSRMQQAWQQVSPNLISDLELTKQLEKILDSERKALETRDYDTFQTLILDKQTTMKTLELHASHRKKVLKLAGYRDEKHALESAEEYSSQVAQAWQQLGTQWAVCQKKNAINEKILQRTKLVVSQMLDMLRGENGNNKVYDATGGTSSTNKGQTITNV